MPKHAPELQKSHSRSIAPGQHTDPVWTPSIRRRKEINKGAARLLLPAVSGVEPPGSLQVGADRVAELAAIRRSSAPLRAVGRSRVNGRVGTPLTSDFASDL